MENLLVVEHKGIRVITTQQLAEKYETNSDIITKNFNRNKGRYVEGKHYFCLKGDELRKFKANGQIDLLPNANVLYLWTERGCLLHAKSLGTDKAWEVYEYLVESYFRVRQIVDDRLSPETKMLFQMINQIAETEIQAKEAKEMAQKAIETTENIKEAVKPIFDNWREEINSKFNRIQRNAEKPFNFLRNEMYSELERRGGCDLGTRLRNKQNRMRENGRTKTEINNLNKMDII